MRTLNFPEDRLAGYTVLVATMSQGSYTTKEIKVAKRIRKKLHDLGERRAIEGHVSYHLSEPASVAFEEAEYEFLKKRFEAITDWVPGAVEAVAMALEILEEAKEDA